MSSKYCGALVGWKSHIHDHLNDSWPKICIFVWVPGLII